MYPASQSESRAPQMNRDELVKHVKVLSERVQKLEELIAIISRGKYMWESTFDAITIPVQIVSRDFRILRANVSAAEVGGGDIVEFPGQHCYEAFAGLDHPCEGCPLNKAIDGDHVESTLLGEPIQGREFEASAYPYGRGSSGEEPLAIMSYRDVTKARRLEQEVIQQEKMAAIGMLAGGVAHEINNPLGGILAFTQLLLRDSGDNASIKEDLMEIQHAADRCKRIVADLLDFSRATSEREKCPIDLHVLLEKVIPFIRGEMRSLNVEFRLVAAGKVPQVFGQPDRLQQVFLNLMTNACHAMPRGGELIVELKKGKNGGACAIFRDSGEGISKEVLPRIFDPFFTTKQPGRGTGLGLSISYRIVREHGGTIHVESIVKKGTVFTILFPPVES